jgi:hypothetical protein
MIIILAITFIAGIGFGLKIAVKNYGWSVSIWAAGFFVVTMIIGAWSILQSRSSTAGIGFIFLPFICLIPAAGGLVIGMGKKKSSVGLMVMGSTLVILSMVYLIKSGLDVRTLNAKRDADYQAQLARQKAVNMELKALFEKNKGNETSALAQYYKSNSSDRAVALEILTTPYVSHELLDELSKSKDMGIALSVIRNANVTADMLENIYKNADYKDYYHSDLARNPKSPTRLLIEVAKGQNMLIPNHLLQNPNTNCEVLSVLAETVAKGYLQEEQKEKYKMAIGEQKKLICP